MKTRLVTFEGWRNACELAATSAHILDLPAAQLSVLLWFHSEPRDFSCDGPFSVTFWLFWSILDLALLLVPLTSFLSIIVVAAVSD